MSTDLLYRGKGFFAVNKPAGVVVIPGRGERREKSLRETLEEELGQKLYVVHRLDRDTSGVLIFATEPRAHRALSMAFEAGRVGKRYLALVAGRLDAPAELDWPLLPSRRGRMRVAKMGERGKAARTRVRPLEAFGSISLIEAAPLTGRSHQIRVHLAAMGHPLIFDHQYGRAEPCTARDLGGDGDELVLERTPLHAASLTIPLLDGLGPVTIDAPLPSDMARVLEIVRGS